MKENALSEPGRITESDYLAAMEELGRSWVIEVHGEIAAFASGYKSGNIWALFVHPDHEGQGHGTVLHSVVVSWLWSQGHSRIWLTTSPGTRAHQFYLSRGWELCGTVPGGEVRLVLGGP